MHETTCNSCSLRLKFKDQFAGKKIRCPKCKTIVSLPAVVAQGARAAGYEVLPNKPAKPAKPAASVKAPPPPPAPKAKPAPKRALTPPPAPPPPPAEPDWLDEIPGELDSDQALASVSPVEDEEPIADIAAMDDMGGLDDLANTDDMNDPFAEEEKPAPKPKKKKKKGGGKAMLLIVLGVLLLGGLGAGGYSLYLSMQPSAPLRPPSTEMSKFTNKEPGDFKDTVASDKSFDKAKLDLTLKDREGKEYKIADFKDQVGVVLVVTRGFSSDGVCPSCVAQTAALIEKYDDLKKLNAEVLLIYPGPKETVDDFLKQAIDKSGKMALPFPLLLDEKLEAVKQLGISGSNEKDPAKPAIFILDKQGELLLAYIGSGTDTLDRPSVNAILKVLREAPKAEDKQGADK